MSNMKPEIRFGEFADAWEQRKLGDIGDIITGSTPSTQIADYYSDDGIPWVTPTDISENITYNTEKRLSIEGQKVGRVVPKNTILITCIASIGKNTMLGTKGSFNQQINGLIPNEDKMDPYFLFTESTLWSLKMKKSASAGTMQIVNKTEFSSLTTMVPGLNEQTKIGKFFKQLDNLITLHQRKLDKMKNLKSAYLSKMFPKEGERYPRLRFAGFTDVWEQRKLGDLGKTFTGLSGKTKNDFGHGDAEFVTYMNVFSNPISNTDQTENVEIDDRQNEVEYGDIFFTTSSETPEEVGMSSVWLGNKPNVYLNSFCFGYRPTEKLDPYYMAYMLRSPEVRKKFLFLAQGISRYNISKTKVMDLFVPIPKIEEQMVIGKFLNNLDNLVNLHQRKLEKLEQFKQAMLKKMFV